jgi:two-component system sensor histidine kinase/response regulator
MLAFYTSNQERQFMSALSSQSELNDSRAVRAEKLFREHQKEIYCDTDRLLARLMVVQWLGGILAAFFISPFTWNGETSAIHAHVWAAIFIGGLITVFPVWLTWAWPGATATRHVIAVAQMLMSALLISLSGGRIETHFHVFGSLVILSFYRDWRVLVPATIVVALDHFLRGIYWPYSVYGVLAASPWRSIEHAAWVIFEEVFLVISCLRSMREMRAIANRTAQLETSEKSFREIFEEAPIGIAVVGLDEQFRQANATFCQMLDYSEQELLARSPIDLTHPEDTELSRTLARQMLSSEGSHRVEKRYLRKNGEVLWAMRTGCVVRDGLGNPRHFLIMIEDISERKSSEDALRRAKEAADDANRAKSEFLSRMSHELRTPLNAILGFGQLLDRQNPTDVQRSRISHITSAGRHLLDLINEVLDISRIEAGRMELSVEAVPLRLVLAETLDLIRPMAADRRIELSAPDDLDNDWHVLADRQRLKQVLLNVLSNSVKYTPLAGTVAVSAAFSGKDVIRLVVSDTGAGIPKEKLSRLFTPFDRLGAEHSDVQGTGLGLALSRRLMDAMGGSIGVESDLGRGSTFWIELPSVASPLQRSALRPSERGAEGKGPATTQQQRTVLYVEDNLSNLTLVEQIIAEQPALKLITAMRGKVGLDLAARHSPDLILLDLHLPDIPGWEVLAGLRANKQTRDIPIIVISADATSGQIERLMAAGANQYLTKPLDVDRFVSVLDQAMANSST